MNVKSLITEVEKFLWAKYLNTFAHKPIHFLFKKVNQDFFKINLVKTFKRCSFCNKLEWLQQNQIYHKKIYVKIK